MSRTPGLANVAQIGKAINAIVSSLGASATSGTNTGAADANTSVMPDHTSTAENTLSALNLTGNGRGWRHCHGDAQRCRWQQQCVYRHRQSND